MTELRIVSLLPSATEIICALGLERQLVAVTHECDYPAAVLRKPHITRSRLPLNLSSHDIDLAVRSQLDSDAHSLYSIDRQLLAELGPDLIITQKLCEVCAVSYDEVLEAVRSLPRQPVVMNLEPMSLAEVLSDIERVGEVAGHPDRARELVASLQRRVDAVTSAVGEATSVPRVGFLEWIDPLFCAGHWNPELIALAGGVDGLGRLHQPSVRIEWEKVVAFAPEVLLISCCGFSAERASQDLAVLEAMPGFGNLPCVRSGRIHVVDGAAYFSRPGPRLVDSLELLAHLVHPEVFQATPVAPEISR